MALYFANTEITGIKDLFPLSSKDITGLYFGDTELFTVWGEYDGTLPATYSANGSTLADYRIYGASGGVGDRTVNLFEVESDMLLSSNWDKNPPYGADARVYFINYKLSNTVTKELKKGIHTCSIFEHFTDGYTPNLLVCAFVPEINNTIDNSYRILSNQGATATKTFDFSEWQDIYLIIGYGNGFETEAEKQSKIDELFTNWLISIVPGSTAPASYAPYGYEVDMYVQTVELRQNIIQGGWNGRSGYPVEPYNTGEFAQIRCRIEPFYVDITKTYTISAITGPLEVAIKEVNANGMQIHDTGWGDTHVVTPMANARWFAITIRKSGNSNITPTDVQCVKIIMSEAITTIYIGDTPLGEDEYVDYRNGKIYRKVDNVLTPTDPPVPLPALPTVDGVNIVDYAGQSAAVPSRFYAKYRKEGFN